MVVVLVQILRQLVSQVRIEGYLRTFPDGRVQFKAVLQKLRGEQMAQRRSIPGYVEAQKTEIRIKHLEMMSGTYLAASFSHTGNMKRAA